MEPKHPHPGPKIRDDLANAGYTIQSAALEIAVSRVTLHRMTAGQTALTRDLAYRISALLFSDHNFEYAKEVCEMQSAHDWEREAEVRAKILATLRRP